jgi:superfamily II DNA or RNA helicase
MPRTLRSYQVEFVDAIRGEWAKGVTRTAVVAATGLGKSTILGKIAVDEARARGRVLILCHLADALDQITATCRDLAPDVRVGRVQAERDQRHAPIVTAMVQTMGSAKRRARMERPTLVIVDECHRAPGPRYMQVLRWAGCFEGTRTLGVTATMVRGDKRGLKDVWETVAMARGIDWAITHGPGGEVSGDEVGWLVRPKGLAVVTDHLDLDRAKVSRGDYQDGELGEMVSQDAVQIAKAWLEHAHDRLTVAFTPSVQAAHDLRDAFCDLGVAAEAVTGATPQRERNRMYGRLARGETRVLASVMITTEAWDCPVVSCAIMARPTKLPGLYAQCVGRTLRLAPGKRDALILDVVGVSRRLSLQTLVDLVPTADYQGGGPRPCPRCGKFRRPPDRFDPKCVCPPAERSENGGRIELVGPQAYAPVDLLADASEAELGDVVWLQTRGGVAFVPAKDRIVALLPDGAGWKAGVVDRDRLGRGTPLVRGASLQDARTAAEAWVAANVEPTYWSRRASWRTKRQPGSEGQIRAARAFGIEAPESYTKAALSDLLSIRAASRRLDRR